MATPEGWVRHSVGTGIASVPILTRDDADYVVAVPARPLLAKDSAGRPKLSLTLVLSKQPSVDEPSIAPLVTQGTIALTATLALPDSANQLAAEANKPVQPLFARAAGFSLRFQGAELQRTEAFGPGATAALSTMLDRDAALSVLSAIQDASSGLSLECDINYAVDSPPRRLHLSGQYSEIYRCLVQDGAHPLKRETLERCVETMLYEGVLTATSEPPGISTTDVTTAFLKVARPVLQRVTAPDGERYSPRRPTPGAWLDVTLKSSASGGLATLNLITGLEEMFRGCLDGEDTAAFIHLVAPDALGKLSPAPNRFVQPPARASREVRALGATSLARVGVSAVALSAAARPNAAIAVGAHTLLADTTVRPTRIDSAKIHHWAVDDLVLAPATVGQPAERSLPVVSDAAAQLWTDRVDSSLRWYAPEFAVDIPAASATAESGSFLFSFHTAGHTMSGAPGLEGRIRCRLVPQMSGETRGAWEAAGSPNAKPVPVQALSVTIGVPFRDQTGSTRSQMFPAVLTMQGDAVIAEVSLLDDWVRLAYGALSTPGFQSQPVAVSVAYTFEAYVPLNENNLALLLERKQALTHVVKEQSRDLAARDEAHFDSGDLSYRTLHELIRFTREPAAPRAAAGSRAPASLAIRPQPAPFIIRPDLVESVALTELVKKQRYGVQSLGRDMSQTASYPCATFGQLYVQEDTEAGPAAIGCRDAFKLGQTEYRQYLRISELDDPEYSVWRSLQQPGRFLLVPARWSIARFAASDPDRAYRPSILVYSTVDAGSAANSRCAVLASLVPDIAPAKRRALNRSLLTLAQQPIVTLVNEIDATLGYAWPLPADLGIDVQAAKLFDSFQVTLVTGIDSMPQMQSMLRTSGVIGTVRYQLPDGTALECSLSLDLNRVVGPSPEGPVQVTLQGQSATLKNRIERVVDVSELVVEAADGRIDNVRVDQRLAPDASINVAVAADATFAAPVVTLAPGDAATLTEIRSFVEDIHTNVVFVNLINYANHGLAQLSLQARLRDVEGTQTLSLVESEPVDTLDFVLPLTSYLANPVLEFAVTRTMTDGSAFTTAWLPWPLVDRGNVVSLTWDQVQ